MGVRKRWSVRWMKPNRIAIVLSSVEKWKREPFLSAPSGISGGEIWICLPASLAVRRASFFESGQRVCKDLFADCHHGSS